ncbi:helix-turn-helix domain-containing protein [Pseudescherichia sp.]|uniref:helix-turn-helix domain-containing protein n=1 Tax=Pseudescherichia sp. TaxID=2055881 RepID=UPI0028A1860E|nr:helix-turn-helix domain-containing protein [Pseudescherichia sp.]
MKPDITHATTLQSSLFASATKPKKSIKHLHNILKPYGLPFQLAASEEMPLGRERRNTSVIFVSTGCFSLCNAANNLYIATLFAPTVVGLVDGYSLFHNVNRRPTHYIHAETHCQGWQVPVDTFAKKCDAFDLWHDIACILAQRMMIMSMRESELVGIDAYGKIRTLLMELALYPREIRNQIKAASFIQRRTRLSRSQTMKILAELKKGNFIEINNGILMAINKLPVGF